MADAGPDQLAVIRPGTTSKAVLLDGSRSFHPDGRIDRYLWNCGNGFQPVSLTPAVVRCVYFSPGDCLATLTLWDDGTGVIEGGQFQCQK